MSRRRDPPRVWRTPLLIALASVLGLLSALVGDGVFDAISWIALGSIIAVVGLAWRRRTPTLRARTRSRSDRSGQ